MGFFKSSYQIFAGHVQMGQFGEAEKAYSICKRLPKPGYHIYRDGDIEYCNCLLNFYQNRLTEKMLEQTYSIALQGRNTGRLPYIWALNAEFLLQKNKPGEALDYIEQAIELSNKTGVPAADYLALRVLALLKANSDNNVENLIEGALEKAGKLEIYTPTHVIAAEVFHLLGQHSKAKEQALKAYKIAWADGPPYIRWNDLEQCKKLLKEMNIPEPELPPFDPNKLEPIPFEAEVRAVIEELRAKKVKK